MKSNLIDKTVKGSTFVATMVLLKFLFNRPFLSYVWCSLMILWSLMVCSTSRVISLEMDCIFFHNIEIFHVYI